MNLDYPEFMSQKEREYFLKCWEKCIPKMSDYQGLKVPIIFGTGGKLPCKKED